MVIFAVTILVGTGLFLILTDFPPFNTPQLSEKENKALDAQLSRMALQQASEAQWRAKPASNPVATSRSRPRLSSAKLQELRDRNLGRKLPPQPPASFKV